MVESSINAYIICTATNKMKDLIKKEKEIAI